MNRVNLNQKRLESSVEKKCNSFFGGYTGLEVHGGPVDVYPLSSLTLLLKMVGNHGKILETSANIIMLGKD